MDWYAVEGVPQTCAQVVVVVSDELFSLYTYMQVFSLSVIITKL